MMKWFYEVETPAFVVDKRLVEKNLQILKYVRDRAGIKVLLALKGFAMFSISGLISSYLDGVCASGLFEAKLGKEAFGKEVHLYAPAYKEDEVEELNKYADTVIFNSPAQLEKFYGKFSESVRKGIRVNPEYSEVEILLYNPAAPHSRFGVRACDISKVDFDKIDGIHFHLLCEQGADIFFRVLNAVEDKFGEYLSKVKWVNMGGGHHITRGGYDIGLFTDTVSRFCDKYGVEAYIEPGEAVALDAGYLVAAVLDIVDNDMEIAVLDTSAETHMPDVLAMPYRPDVVGAGKPGEKRHTYRFAGPTCLSGDIIGDYSFDNKLKPGDRVVFCDMAHYSMVKTTMFNGINLPSIYLLDENGVTLVKRFGYSDYKMRLS